MRADIPKRSNEPTGQGALMTVSPGWYADPGVAGWWRWFDGAAWTAYTHPMQQTPMQQPGFAYGFAQPPPRRDRALEMVVPINRAPLAIVAGYLGLFSLILLPGPIAVVVSIVALKQLRTTPEVGGRGRAWFGLIAGSFASLILAITILNAAGKN
jgi:hypothetical protein